jgi:cyclopropane-fatty-acyl-phospholipid synthase
MSSSVADAAARAAVLRLGRQLREGTIVLDEDGVAVEVGQGAPVVGVTVRDGRAYGALLRGSNGLAHSYAAGWWACDDLTTLVRVLLRGLRAPMHALDRLATATRPVLDPLARLRRPDRQTDRRHIQAHYDIGNDFYELMLDPGMTYSCAVFERPGMSLEDAQAAKLDRVCRLLALAPSDHVLEIGTGWGSFAVHAAERYGCRVTTTTISDAQHDYATKRVAEAGLTDRVTVLDTHYGDLDGVYDKLASIEMIEAVDWRDHHTFFSRCAELLRPDGVAALQAIVIADDSFDRAKRHDDFIRRTIFPGGCLPSITRLAESSGRAGFRLLNLEDIGHHYPRTLRSWRANVAAHDREVAALGLGPEFRRRWELYLAYCEAAFLEHHVSDIQVLLAKPSRRAGVITSGEVTTLAPHGRRAHRPSQRAT